MKSRSDILAAIILSISVHCTLAALLGAYPIGMLPLPLPLKILTVDIRTLQLPEERKDTDLSPPVPSRRKPQAMPASPRRVMPAPVNRPAPSRAPETSTVPVKADGSVMSANSPTLQPLQGAMAKGAVAPAGTEKRPSHPVAGNPLSGGTLAATKSRPDSAYLAALRALIERHKEYPPMARRGRMEGTVRISCVLSRKGNLKGATVVQSSGHTILDSAALRAVNTVDSFPDIPPEIEGDTFTFSVPITYRLTGAGQ